MLRHIVLFTMGASEESQRTADREELTAALAAMPARIPEILDLTVGDNVVDGPSNADLALIVDLEDREALERYRVHPDHRSVMDLIGRVTSGRSVADLIL